MRCIYISIFCFYLLHVEGNYPLKISFVAGLKYNIFVPTPPIGTCRIGFTKKPATAGLRAPPFAFRHIELAAWEAKPAFNPIAIEFVPCLDTFPRPALPPIATAPDP